MNFAALEEQVKHTFDFLKRRKTNYQLALTSPAGQAVLIDLAKFCRANATCFDADPRVNAALEGRREVWLRIQQHLNLTPEQLVALYGGAQFVPLSGDDQDG